METKQPQKPSEVATSKQTTAEVHSAKDNQHVLSCKERITKLFADAGLEVVFPDKAGQQFVRTFSPQPDEPKKTHKMTFVLKQRCDSSQSTESQPAQFDSSDKYDGIVLHIPHASTSLPERYMRHGDEDWTPLYEAASRDLIDHQTASIFTPYEDMLNLDVVSFKLCRTLCDVERLPNDPLESKGLGIVSRIVKDKDGNIIRMQDYPVPENPDKSLYDELVEIYHQHQQRLVQSIEQLSEGSKRVLLIDCHSFSSRPTLLCATPPDVDICIGFNEDETKPSDFVINSMQYYFSSLGYKVALNTPFSNSKTVDCPQVKYKSVMIEVNKRLYMNEDTLEKTEHFPILQQQLRTLYGLLLHCGFVEQFD